MSYDSNIQRYIQLIKRFCLQEISAEQFSGEYLALWEADRDEEDERMNTWTRRYDIELQDSLSKGMISQEEFTARWYDLWGITEIGAKKGDILNRIFTARNCFWADITPDEVDPPLVLDEHLLRKEVTALLQELENVIEGCPCPISLKGT
jgi:hypothetical protein